MNPPTTLTNHNPPATIGCGLNPNPIRREESDTPHYGHYAMPDTPPVPTHLRGASTVIRLNSLDNEAGFEHTPHTGTAGHPRRRRRF